MQLNKESEILMTNLYNNKFNKTKMLLKIEDIIELEKKYNFTFPKDIRDHYLTYNGGEPEKYVFIDADGDELIVQQFISINKENEKGRDLDSVLHNLRTDKILPDWLIPIADEPGGDLYCFSLKTGEEGWIYLWHHEYINSSKDSSTFLAESIREFMIE
jgi:cell wall assembly regulator SMI1